MTMIMTASGNATPVATPVNVTPMKKLVTPVNVTPVKNLVTPVNVTTVVTPVNKLATPVVTPVNKLVIQVNVTTRIIPMTPSRSTACATPRGAGKQLY